MKRLLLLLLALSILVLGLSPLAYSRTAVADSPVTLQLFVGKINSPPTAQRAVMGELIAEFENANPSITVKYSTFSSASAETTILETSLATRTGPNVFELGSTIIPVGYATGGFSPLTAADWAAAGGRNRFFPAQLSMSGPTPDKQIAIPEYMLPFALLYNKAMFKAAGIASPPTTWTQFIADAQKLTIPSKNQWGVVMDPSDSFDPWHIIWVLTRQLGGEFVTPDLKHATLTSTPVYQATRFWMDWLTKYKIANPADVTYHGVDALAAFAQAHAAMMVMQGATLLPTLNKSVVKNDYAYAPMPTIPYGMSSLPKGGVPVQTFISGQYYNIPTYVTGATRAATLKWINFITSVPQQRLFFQYYGYLPINPDAYKGYAPLNTPLIKTFVTAEAHAYSTPFTGAWGPLEISVGAATSRIAAEYGTNSYHTGDLRAALSAVNTAVQSSLK